MKKFLYNIGLFFLIVFLFYAVLLGRYIIKMRSYGFELPKEKTVLVMGDSQTQADIDDEILYNVKNLSLNHDGYFTFYKRLQLYVDANPQIDTLLLAITPHTVSPVKDEFYYNFGYIEETTKHYLPYFSLSEWWQILKTDPADVVSALVTPLRYYWNVSPENISEMGNFTPHDKCNLESDIKSGAERLVPSLAQGEYGNDITLKYLTEIIKYCKEKDITLLGINTPVYHGERYFDMHNYNSLKSTLLKHVEIWDDMDMAFPDSCRRDVNHLNRKGATIYSNILKKRMNL